MEFEWLLFWSIATWLDIDNLTDHERQERQAPGTAAPLADAIPKSHRRAGCTRTGAVVLLSWKVHAQDTWEVQFQLGGGANK